MFELLLKSLPVTAYYSIASMLLTKLGNHLKNKDADDKGKDDVAGKICLAFAPAIVALGDNSENAFRKALTVAREAIDAYLKLPAK